MTDAALRAQLASYIAEADDADLAALIDALEAALVGRVHPHVAALMRASVHGIRLTLARSRSYAAREAAASGRSRRSRPPRHTSRPSPRIW